jgi:hypothetical protein
VPAPSPWVLHRIEFYAPPASSTVSQRNDNFRIALRETKQANDPRPRYSKKTFANMNKDASEAEITIEFQGTWNSDTAAAR